MSKAVSPLAPLSPVVMPLVPGVELATGRSGTRYRLRDDLALLVFAPGTTVGGVLTRNRLPGHPILWCRQMLEQGLARALIVNAGNANVLNGPGGDAAVRAETEAVAQLIHARPENVFVASTGVIGEPLLVEPIVAALPEMHQHLEPGRWAEAAHAIMTTDTFAKMSTARALIGSSEVTVAGIAKGSGMIHPDMATLLAFVATDARLPAPVLQAMVVDANRQAFQSITVDSDTSTSDMFLAFATGQADHEEPLGPDDPLLADLHRALVDVAVDLAKQVVKDGEGATKFIEIRVMGAIDDHSARKIALTVANSPLVKTAIAGEDANWGRIVMAVGKSYEPVQLECLGVSIGGHPVARNGCRVPALDEAPIAAHLAGKDIEIEILVGGSSGSATIWTCDLTHGYIDINADYRS